MKAACPCLGDRIIEDFWKGPNARVGLKLPTERELEHRYQISRPTVTKAIAALPAVERRTIWFAES